MSMTAMGIGLLQTAGKPDGSGGFIAIPLAEVAAYTQAPLGFTHLEPASSQMSKAATDASYQSGDREWIYVYNNSVADLTPGTVCFRNDFAGDPQRMVVGAAGAGAVTPSVIVGVAQHTIPAGFCGFILRKGAGIVEITGAIAPYDGLILSATVNGEAQAAAAATNAVFGHSLSLVGGGGGPAEAILNCAG